MRLANEVARGHVTMPLQISNTPTSAPAIAFSTTPSFMTQYSKDDLQQIFKTVLDLRSLALLAPTLAPVITPHYKRPCERSLKAHFLDIY